MGREESLWQRSCLADRMWGPRPLIKNKEAILFNRFRVGAIYSQDDICKELGISRTPVREALLELQKDGYVSFSRGKGVQVVPVSDRDARDILETRMYIECINAKLAANRAAQRDLQAMRESLDRLRDQLSTRDGQHLYRLDHIFHRAVAAATQNRLLYRECELLLDHYLRFEVKSVYNNSIDAKIVFDEHVAICDAIAEGSAERAEQAMARHLTNSYRRTVSRFWAE